MHRDSAAAAASATMPNMAKSANRETRGSGLAGDDDPEWMAAAP